MQRRDFLRFAAYTVAAMVVQGQLPLLAAEKKRPRGGGKALGTASNCYTEPPAIEPVTGYLEAFAPVAGGSMSGNFSARYALIHWQSADSKSHNTERGSLTVDWHDGRLNTVESRTNHPCNRVRSSITCKGPMHTAEGWTLESSMEGKAGCDFAEQGAWDGHQMIVKAKSWTQASPTTHPLIARWALPPLLAKGQLTKEPLTFDMLDDSTLRPNQTLHYEGEFTIPVKGGQARLQSYVQTGNGIVPTHYLMDGQGRVQLITMSMVNWALVELKV